MGGRAAVAATTTITSALTTSISAAIFPAAVAPLAAATLAAALAGRSGINYSKKLSVCEFLKAILKAKLLTVLGEWGSEVQVSMVTALSGCRRR